MSTSIHSRDAERERGGRDGGRDDDASDVRGLEKRSSKTLAERGTEKKPERACMQERARGGKEKRGV
jgi:hypothetical protein